MPVEQRLFSQPNDNRTPLSRVLKKLENHFPPGVHIIERSRRISSLLNEYSRSSTKFEESRLQSELALLFNHKYQNFQNPVFSYENPFRSPEKTKKELEEITVSYLFSNNRRLFKEKFPHAEYDYEKEARQIEAVVSLLVGNHLHMGTGEGKSAVVLPIYSIVHALTSSEHDAILSTGNEHLLDELKQNTQNLLDRVHKENRYFPDIDLETPEESEKDPNPIRDDLFNIMQREALTRGKYSTKTTDDLSSSFWTYRIEQVVKSAQKRKKSFLDKDPKRKRIAFITERQLVFNYLEDRETFKKRAPKIIMDEADISYNRGTPYEQERSAFYYTPEEITESTSIWLMNYIIAQHIKSDDLITYAGRTSLKSESLERISNEADLNNLSIGSSVHRAFIKGIGVIANSLGLDDQEKGKMTRRIKDYFKKDLPSRKASKEQFLEKSPMQDYVTDIAETIAGVYQSEGKSFIFKETDAEPQLRDVYIDELLKGHTHQSHIQTAIYALNGKYKFIPQRKMASSVTTFETFIFDNADKISCTSGSLLYRDLCTNEQKRGAFADFLEDITQRKVHLIDPPEKKISPEPEFFATNNDSLEKLVNDVTEAKQAKKPGLIVCFDRNEGQMIYEACKEKFEEDRVIYLPLNPHPDEVKKYCMMLAEGEIDVLISAGNIGFGADIKKSDGAFPDLKVFIYNLPQTQMQIIQALGRRRKRGSDYAWYISRETIEIYISLFEDKDSISFYEEKFGKKKFREQMEKRFQLTWQNPEESLQYAIDLIRQHEITNTAEYENKIRFDKRYGLLLKEAESLLREKLIREKKGVVDAELDEEEKENVRWTIEQYGLPEDLYWDFFREITQPGLSERSAHSPIAVIHRNEELIYTWLNRKIAETLPEKIDAWANIRKKTVDEFMKIVYMNGSYLSNRPIQFISFPEFNEYYIATSEEAQTGNSEGYVELGGISALARKIGGMVHLALAYDTYGIQPEFINYSPIAGNLYGIQILPTTVQDENGLPIYSLTTYLQNRNI